MEPTVNITLKEIIERKIFYCQNERDIELVAMNKGYVHGFTQMLSDMNLTETKFISKYLNIVKSLKAMFESLEDRKELSEAIDELSGYNNAIIDILSLLNEKYQYEENC